MEAQPGAREFDGERIDVMLLTLLTDLLSVEAMVAGYRATATEIDVSAVLRAWSDWGGDVVVPAPSSFSQRGQGPVEWDAWTPTRLPGSRISLPDPTFGAVLVPGIAFGRDGRRLGRGAGWYDRALAGLPGRTVVVGVCHAKELVGPGLIPVEPHDRGVDFVVTPEEVWPVRSDLHG